MEGPLNAAARACFSADSSVVPMPVTVISLMPPLLAVSDSVEMPPKFTSPESWAWEPMVPAEKRPMASRSFIMQGWLIKSVFGCQKTTTCLDKFLQQTDSHRGAHSMAVKLHLTGLARVIPQFFWLASNRRLGFRQ